MIDIKSSIPIKTEDGRALSSSHPYPNIRAYRLRELLFSNDLTLLMEAHNGLSARIAERAGFHAIWASGLTLSSSMALRDANEATWTEILSILDWMLAATKVPILFDADTGYGNFNNFRRLVKTLSHHGIAGLVIEDKGILL